MAKNDRRRRERRLHYRLMHRIYKLCGQYEWRLVYIDMFGNPRVSKRLGLTDRTGRPVTACVGMVDEETRTIFVDYREDVIATFVHECLHILIGDSFVGDGDGKAEEAEVQRLEKMMMRHMSPSQARRLHVHMTNMLGRISVRHS
ncbi:MAG TPA: hypothetical protein VL426_00255 [Candidatus Binatia bacterium]|jgi:hypothetical protein|nr:hypothetical protein [Candidatus Binatia bacterium]